MQSHYGLAAEPGAGRRLVRQPSRRPVEELPVGCGRAGRPDQVAEYPHFVTALSLVAALPPGEVVPLLRTRLEALAGQRAEIQGMIDSSLAQGVPRLFLVEEEYRLALLDAESAFVEQFIAEIGDPRLAGARP